MTAAPDLLVRPDGAREAAPASRPNPLLSVEDLVVAFSQPRSFADVLARRPARTMRAVDGASFSVRAGETLGLVGESGSGKSTIGRAILGLHRPASGRIRFDGEDVSGLDRQGEERFRRRAQMVFQDPYGSLNPRMSVAAALREVLRVHAIVPPGETDSEIRRLLDLVGLPPAMAERLPRSMSGGQRQRVVLARAFTMRPEFLVLDEPVAALDVSIQAQVLNLLLELRARLNLTMLFVAHEMGVIRYMSDRVAVMYLGQIMEIGPAAAVFDRPSHPYTRSLIAAVPRPQAVKRKREPVLKGELPSPYAVPTGCRFHTRCPIAQPMCAEIPPPVVRSADGAEVRCHFPG
jgi:oligopeptide/dipeptide ABC transporter ATP-binding protein